MRRPWATAAALLPGSAMVLFLFRNAPEPARVSALPERAQPLARHLLAAAERHGVSFDYLARTAERESRFDPKARASTSTATGLFQFIEQTWLSMVRQEGARAGLAEEAAAIRSRADGSLTIDDPSLRRSVLALREDPSLASDMAAALARRNAESLARALGRTPGARELYTAHVLGASGAVRFLKAVATTPDAPAAAAFPEAATANRPLFYGSGGRALSFQEVQARLTRGFEESMVAVEDARGTIVTPRPATSGPAFHGLFRTAAEPVAPSVAALWRTPAASPADPVASARTTTSVAAPLDLLAFSRMNPTSRTPSP